MTSTSPVCSGVTRGWRLVSAIAFGLFLGLSGFAAEAVKKTFDVPADKAVRALKQFAAQSGGQLLYAPEDLAGVQTLAVKGEFTARNALEKMLAGSPLVVTQDQATGALAVRREDVAEAKNGGSRPLRDNASAEGSAVRMEKLEIVEKRIDGLINKGLLQGGADAPLYHDVVTRVDIERMGVTSLEELLRLIPQTSSPTTSLQDMESNTNLSGGQTLHFSTMGLRGFGSAQTVILVNGRALPRTGVSDSDGADLSRIPLAAIERVEILPSAGSAIYGAGAIGGAINIILRKDYAGKDLTTYIGTSSDGGGTEYRVSYVDGRRFNDGRTSITTSFSYQHREALLASDRGYLDEALRRYGPNTTAKTADGISLFESMILPAFAGAPGTIVISSSESATADLGIPGASGTRYASIPVGTSWADSFTLTPSSFTATAGKANLSSRYGRSVLYEPIEAYSLNTQIEHELIKDKLSSYGEFTAGYNHKHYTYPQYFSVSLSATDPLNPFRTNVTPGFVGRAVTVYLDNTDIPDNSVTYKYESARGVAGLKGKLNERWEWSVDGVVDYTHNTVNSQSPVVNALDLNELYYSSTSAAASVRRAVYAILADHSTYPISASDLATYFTKSARHMGTHAIQAEGNARVTGDLFEIPAGTAKLSAFAKYQRWSFTSGQVFEGSDAAYQLLYGKDYPNTVRSSTYVRELAQGAVELSIPIIGKQWRPVPIESFELQGSVSYEADATKGTSDDTPYTNRKSASSNVIAGKLQVVPDVALRASYSEGFYPPNWGSVSPSEDFTFSFPGLYADPLRGNTIQSSSYTVAIGTNPNLRPESAKSLNYGVIFTPRFLPNFSLTLDYWKTNKEDAILNTVWIYALQNPVLYSIMITRADPTAEEAAKGWAGVITAVDQRPMNASSVLTDGFDARLRYEYKTANLGSFIFNGNTSFTNQYELKTTPTATAVDIANGSGPVRWRGMGSVTWSKERWSTTLTGRYVGHYSTGTTSPSASYPIATGYDGERIPAYLHWDTQVSYELPARFGGRTWRDWLSATKWTLGVNNVLNDKPAFVSNGTSFYSVYDDPRQRYIYLSVTKSL